MMEATQASAGRRPGHGERRRWVSARASTCASDGAAAHVALAVRAERSSDGPGQAAVGHRLTAWDQSRSERSGRLCASLPRSAPSRSRWPAAHGRRSWRLPRRRTNEWREPSTRSSSHPLRSGGGLCDRSCPDRRGGACAQLSASDLSSRASARRRAQASSTEAGTTATTMSRTRMRRVNIMGSCAL